MPLPTELNPGQTCERFLSVDAESRKAIDTEKRTISLAFSSETGVDRGWGIEVLDHRSGSIRMDRLKSGGPVLMDHDSRDQVGVIESVQIGADKVGRAVVRFGRGARADEVFNDIVDGIRTNVSVAYRIHAAVLDSSKDGIDTYRITDWEPYEISIVSVPADPRVGVGRSGAPTKNEESPVSDTTQNSPATAPAAAANAPHIDITAHQRSGADAERKRVAEILGTVDAYRANHDLSKLGSEAVRSGMSLDEFRGKALEAIASAPKPTAEIGITPTETKRYSMMRALAYLANPGDARLREAAKFELECSAAAAQRSGKTAQGLMVPYEVLQRDLTVGTPADGGYLVATNLLNGSFIDLLRNAMVIDSLGAQFLTGLVGNIAIPKQSGAGSAYWVTEGNAPTASKQGLAQVPMAPKTVGAYTDISRKLLLQSSIDVEAFVQGDLAKVLGLAIQAAAIQGGGSNEPTGIIATGSIGSVAGGTDGAAPTWGNIIELETDVSVANADIGTLAYLTNAKVRGKLKGMQKFSGTDGNPVWAEGNTPLNGYRAAVSNAVPSNLVKGGSGAVCSAILFGNFADLIIGMWGGLDLMVDPYSNSTSGTVRVVALQDVDVAVRHAESFSAMLDALTA
jgi:HK97 family phage major capsid protein/HK97 family phage prohead protease